MPVRPRSFMICGKGAEVHQVVLEASLMLDGCDVVPDDLGTGIAFGLSFSPWQACTEPGLNVYLGHRV